MLRISRITVKFGKLTILRSLSLDVPSGAIVGLVGRNGAGKTTTLKSIIGLVPVVSGEILLDGQNILTLSPRNRVKLGVSYMPEDRRLIAPLSVHDNLLLPAWAQGREDAEDLLQAVYGLSPEFGNMLKNFAPQRASQLSGGQQKLVALARSVLTVRKLLLLDEPLEGVAIALGAKLAESVRKLQKREPDLSILVAESDLNRMRLFTDNILTIERGEVIQAK